ncbi:2-aminoethanethiol dioxygenase [Orchesella cincta]|uniref:2-aminoethanethiol dioxygenase n=1 Tax=Orchesella cincta TaxID=48709 RepID=A0A1D2NAI8_ORCCI|nr:2-aminoethanethiol dioxygenase [Orchesella cincta]
MSNSVIKNLLTKAFQAFKLRPLEGETSEASQSAFISELTHLQEAVRAVTGEDLSLEETVKSIPKSNQQPVTFVDIFENSMMTMMVIIMKPGSRIPLHDHPNMYGMIKVLAGQIRVQSYTLLDEPGKIMDHHTPKNTVLSALRMPETVLSKVSSPVTLAPEIRNVHEIECICGESADKNYAAFLDILSPPYPDADSCHYFRAEDHSQRTDGSGELRKCRLVQIECPKDYFTACSSVGPF